MIPHGLAGWSDALRGFAPAVANHVWQSTAFALVAAALAFALKQNHARARYWIWMAASLKFAVPFALLAALGSHFARPRPVAPSQPAIYFAMQDVSEPFGGEIPPAAMDVAAPPSLRMTDVLPLLIGVVWLVGFVASLTVWGMRWRRVARTIRAAMPVCAGREFEALRRVEQAAGLALASNCGCHRQRRQSWSRESLDWGSGWGSRGRCWLGRRASRRGWTRRSSRRCSRMRCAMCGGATT
jgi:hypothetical protein